MRTSAKVVNKYKKIDKKGTPYLLLSSLPDKEQYLEDWDQIRKFLKQVGVGSHQILENELFSEFSLPYIDQTQTPTQFLNEFVKNKYDVKKIITPQNLGPDAHEQIMLWGLTKARKLND